MMMKKWSWVGMGVCSIVLSGTMAWAMPTMVSISPSTQTVNPGDTFTVDIMINEPLPSTVQSFEFDLDFDSSVLMATGVSEGGFLSGSSTSVGENDIAAPDVNFAVTASGTAVNDFTLPAATITFNVLGTAAPGSILLDLNDIFLFDDMTTPIFLEIPSNESSVTINSSIPVPEPSTLLLLGTGFASLGGFRWLKKARNS